MKKLFLAPSYGIVAILLITCLVGCGLTKAQKDGIAAFGKASSTLGTASKEQFQGGRENIIQMNRQIWAIEGKTLSPRAPDGRCLCRPLAADCKIATREKPEDLPECRAYFAKALNLDSGISLGNIEKRVNAVELLIQYGNLLIAFSEETQEKELNEAATKFMDSVKAFPDNTLSAEQISGLGQVVIIGGKWWVENEKKKALKQIIPVVSPLMAKICDALERDFDLKKPGVVQGVFNRQDRLANEAIDGLKSKGGSIADRMILIDGFSFADRNKAAVETASQNILKSVESLRKADKNLTSLIANENISTEDIKAFADDAKTLANAIKPFIK